MSSCRSLVARDSRGYSPVASGGGSAGRLDDSAYTTRAYAHNTRSRSPQTGRERWGREEREITKSGCCVRLAAVVATEFVCSRLVAAAWFSIVSRRAETPPKRACTRYNIYIYLHVIHTLCIRTRFDCAVPYIAINTRRGCDNEVFLLLLLLCREMRVWRKLHCGGGRGLTTRPV